jgi:Ni/Co efflux regulator RcnB
VFKSDSVNILFLKKECPVNSIRFPVQLSTQPMSSRSKGLHLRHIFHGDGSDNLGVRGQATSLVLCESYLSGATMRLVKKAVALSTLAVTFSVGFAFAQDHDHYVRHDEWKKGAHIRQEDWKRGETVDYRHYHLQEPPRGYEWRQVDGNYVLAAAATGVIATAIVASTVH